MLFRLNRTTKEISQVPQTDLITQGFLETKDLEEWFISTQSILNRKLVWIGRQDQPSGDDRSDILAVDEFSELLVVELKRGYVDKSTITQALTYASQYSKYNPERLFELYAECSGRTTATPLKKLAMTVADAEREVVNVAGTSDINGSQTIILVGTSFDPAVLEICEYINNNLGQDPKFSTECWKISLFADDGSVFIQLVQILPVPDLSQQITQAREERRASKYSRDKNRITFMTQFKEKALARGIVIPPQRGASYYCRATFQEYPAVTISIYENPELQIPIDGNFNLSAIDPARLTVSGLNNVFRINPFDFAITDRHQAAIQELIDVLTSLSVPKVESIDPAQA
jgi:hypothetical protein